MGKDHLNRTGCSEQTCENQLVGDEVDQLMVHFLDVGREEQQTANLATLPGTAAVYDGRQTSGYRRFALGSAGVPGLYVQVRWSSTEDRPKSRTLRRA